LPRLTPVTRIVCVAAEEPSGPVLAGIMLRLIALALVLVTFAAVLLLVAPNRSLTPKPPLKPSAGVVVSG